MKLQIDITTEEYSIIAEILQKHLNTKTKIWAFGSRVTHKARFNSDLDLAIEAPQAINHQIIQRLKEDFNDAAIAFSIDVLDMHTIDDNFKNIINKTKIIFPIKHNVPTLRFSEFSDKWQEKQLVEILEYEQPTKYIVKSNKYSNLFEIPVLTAGKTFLLGYTNEKENTYKNYPVIIFDDFTTSSQFVNFEFKVKSSAMKILKLKKPNNSLKLVYEIMQVLDFSIGNHKRYWISEYSQQKISIPTFPEQQKIADFLSAVDKKIELLQQKKQALEQYKKGLMQKIFNQDICFTDNNGKPYPAWQEKQLVEILEYEQSTKYIVKSNKYSNLFEIPVLTAGKTFLLGYTNEKENTYKNYPVIIFDDFTTSSQFVNFEFKVKSNAMKILKLKKPNNSLKLVYEIMQVLDFSIGGHKCYWISEYSQQKISIPTFPEQQKIADFLSAVDKKIESADEKYKQAQQFKKALLQQMFI